MKSTRDLGQHYRNRTLGLLGRLGYGTTRQIARGVWGNLTPSTRKMAARTIARLLNDGLVVRKRDKNSINGEQLVALTKSGAASIDYSLPNAHAHARDWLRHSHSHRTAANSVFVSANEFYFDGIEGGCTELEIRAADGIPENMAKFDFTMDGQPATKIPDCVVRTDNGLAWVEVENNWRSEKDLTKLIQFMRTMFYLQNPPMTQIWLVVTAPGAQTIGRRLRKRLTHEDPRDGTPRQLRELDARMIASKIRLFHLNTETMELVPEEF